MPGRCDPPASGAFRLKATPGAGDPLSAHDECARALRAPPGAGLAVEARQRPLAQGHDAQIDDLDRQAATPVSVASTVRRQELVTNPCRLVAVGRDGHLVPLP